MEELDYMTEYETFMNNFNRTEVSGAEVGEVVVKMAGYFARYNVRKGETIRRFSAKKSEFQNSPDPATGKAISASKANTLADSTEEAGAFEMARIHVDNIEQYINALKSLQKGVLIEYNNAG